MPATKVYISSTYRDLKEHRSQLIDFFQKFPDLFSLVSMEGYVASDITPIQKCLDDVASCELYILVLAQRYGFISEDAAINPGGLSVTEMEYRCALEGGQRKILIFLADEKAEFEKDTDTNGNISSAHQQKLQAFKTFVRNKHLTHPEGFFSPHSLALQVSESLMRNNYIRRAIDDSRRYCINRGLQFGAYLKIQHPGRFKTILIHGESKELGMNFINRIGIFLLNLTETDFTPPFTFEELLGSPQYEVCRNGLLMKLFFKIFQHNKLDDISVAGFLKAVSVLPKAIAVTVVCDEDNFNTQQKAFLIRFLEEFYLESSNSAGNNLYLFVYLQEYDDDSTTQQRIDELKSKLPNAASYCFDMPRLDKLSRSQVKNWLLEYVCHDEGSVEELLMEAEFSNLGSSFTMMDANKRLRKFIQRLNNKDPDLMSIIG
jgi:hypothetical protein